jgi:hypothetical protein
MNNNIPQQMNNNNIPQQIISNDLDTAIYNDIVRNEMINFLNQM